MKKKDQMRLDDYGRRVEFWVDGDKLTPVQMEQNTWQLGVSTIGSLSCWGLGNVDSTYYTEGWTESMEGGMYRITIDDSVLQKGSVHDLETVVRIAIREGDWEAYYDDWKTLLVEQFERDSVIAQDTKRGV